METGKYLNSGLWHWLRLSNGYWLYDADDHCAPQISVHVNGVINLIGIDRVPGKGEKVKGLIHKSKSLQRQSN